MFSADRALELLPELVNADPALVRRGRFLTTTFLVEVGDTPWSVSVVEGRIARVERGAFLLREFAFAIRAPLDAWERVWQPVPEPGWHDLFALVKRGAARIDGALHLLMAHLQYVKDVVRLMGGPEMAPHTPPRSERPGEPGPLLDNHPRIEPIIGRYVRLAIAGVPHRVMNDDAITRHFRVIAFDLPGHGKSTPPLAWRDEEYRLTARAYMDTILAVSDALGLDRPVGLGCSIGGRIVLHLAMEHADRFRALIGLESADWQQPWYDATWLHRPDVHGGDVSAALVSGLIGPTSPEEARWETLWTYMISGPGVFKGDLHFYRVDSDLRGRTSAIDTRQCPLYLMTGEYDFSCTPEDTQRTATAIPGARVTVMKGLGHFPMSEDPGRFRTYVLPVLEEIRARQV